MQLVTYNAGQGPRVGRLVDAGIADLGETDMTRLLFRPDWQELARAAGQAAPTVPLEAVRLMAPVHRPGKFIGIGLNYVTHAVESGMAVPKEPVLFAKFPNAVTGPYDPIPHPGEDVATQLDWEVELGIVIGRTCRRVTEAEALSYVAGYTVINDVSARDLQFFDGQWLKGKSCDGFAPMGPALVTADEIPDPQALHLTMHVNGQEMQNGHTGKMIFGVAALVSYLSRLMTLEPGDVIASGTPDGVGMGRKPQVWLKAGDVCRGEISSIGVIENRIEPA